MNKFLQNGISKEIGGLSNLTLNRNSVKFERELMINRCLSLGFVDILESLKYKIKNKSESQEEERCSLDNESSIEEEKKEETLEDTKVQIKLNEKRRVV